MSGGALGSAAAGAIRNTSIRSITASTFLLAGSQALGILTAPTGVRRGTFNDFAVNPGEASDTVSYIAGTVETTPHLITYFDFHSKKVKNDVEINQMLINAGLSGLAGYIAGGGTFGIIGPDPPSAYIGLAEGTVLGAITAGLGQLRTASYRYYCGFLYGICHGPIDSITAVKVDERIVSNGAPADTAFLIDDPQAWGGDHVDGGVYAICDIISGKFWPQQLPNTYLLTQVSNAASFSGKAMFLIGGFTRAAESGYFAATPQGSPAVRPLKLRVRRLPDNLGVTDYHDINGDANIAECCFEWLTSPVFGVKKLPLSKIDVASFQLGAQTHHTRGIGISVEMNSDVDVETALDKFTDLGGSIIYGSFNSGTIRYKVIERNYSIPSLPVFRRGPDGSSPEAYNVIRRDGFTPGSWASTANDYAFDYVDRDNNYLKTTRYAQDTANRMLTGRVRSLSQSLDGVSNGTTAAFVGTRELRAGSYPRPPLTLVVNRDGYQREPGDVVKYIDNVDNFVKILRITEVQKLATDSTAEIILNCVEDQYGVGAAAYSPFVPAGFHLTLHLNLALEDDYNALGDASTVLPGLKDAIQLSLAVHTAQGVSDMLEPLSDVALIQLRGVFEQVFSDSINNLDDAFASNAVGKLTEAFADDINNLADTASVLAVSLTTPEVELDARNLTGSDGSNITLWEDSSSHNRDASLTVGAGPILKTNVLNGHSIARFDSSVTALDFSGNSSTPTFTVIAIVKCTDGNARSILADRSNGSNAPIFRINANKIELLELDVGVTGTSTTALNTTSFYTVCVTFDDTTNNFAFYLNGTADGSGTQPATFSRRFGGIGIRGGNLDRFLGDIAYVAYWASVLNSTELTTRFDNLRSTWGHY